MKKSADFAYNFIDGLLIPFIYRNPKLLVLKKKETK